MKRVFDIFVSTTLLLSMSWLLLLIALTVRLKLGSPVLFSQMRPGKNGKPFSMLKFRSMTESRDHDGHLLPDVERLPPFGQFLRSTSLDELPELWNVLKGDMSLVGPRPLLMEYLPLYTTEQARRHEVRPGITGWAQVNGRDELPVQDKVKLDIEYLEAGSFAMDLKTIWMTVGKVLRSKDISH